MMRLARRVSLLTTSVRAALRRIGLSLPIPGIAQFTARRAQPQPGRSQGAVVFPAGSPTASAPRPGHL